MSDEPQQNREYFESAIRALEAEIANLGTHLTIDAHARQTYMRQIQIMAADLRRRASAGKITWLTAASDAQETRNIVMEVVRTRSTPVGLAMAQRLKSEGRTLNELVARKTLHLYGKNAQFSRLTNSQQNAVFGEIVKSTGKSNPQVSVILRNLSYAGRGLIFVSIALSVYSVATADSKLETAGNEVAVTGAGIGGGFGGGAIAGLVCGPGAPVCVTIGAFVGGALAAFGVSFIW